MKDDLEKIFTRVSPSIVTVSIYEKTTQTLDFFTGFIIYSDRTRSLVCVHKSAVGYYQDLYIHFSDGTVEKSTILDLEDEEDETIADLVIADHLVILETKPSKRYRSVIFNESEVKREDIFTIAEVEGGYVGFNFLRGTVIAPCCEALDENLKNIVPESTNMFALSCPAKNVLGAPVFDMEGLLVGVIIAKDDLSHRLKFALQACHFVDELQHALNCLDEKFLLSKSKSKVKKIRKLEVLEGYNEDVSRVCKLQVEQVSDASQAT